MTATIAEVVVDGTTAMITVGVVTTVAGILAALMMVVGEITPTEILLLLLLLLVVVVTIVVHHGVKTVMVGAEEVTGVITVADRGTVIRTQEMIAGRMRTGKPCKVKGKVKVKVQGKVKGKVKVKVVAAGEIAVTLP
jgi:hypothetical protein